MKIEVFKNVQMELPTEVTRVVNRDYLSTLGNKRLKDVDFKRLVSVTDVVYEKKTMHLFSATKSEADRTIHYCGYYGKYNPVVMFVTVADETGRKIYYYNHSEGTYSITLELLMSNYHPVPESAMENLRAPCDAYKLTRINYKPQGTSSVNVDGLALDRFVHDSVPFTTGSEMETNQVINVLYRHSSELYDVGVEPLTKVIGSECNTWLNSDVKTMIASDRRYTNRAIDTIVDTITLALTSPFIGLEEESAKLILGAMEPVLWNTMVHHKDTKWK